GKQGINVMMVHRFSLKSNVVEVKEQIKATIQEAYEEAVQKVLAAFNSMAVGTASVRQRCEKPKALSNGQKFKEEDYTKFYGLVFHTNLLVVEAQVDVAVDG
nr:tetratricopeptide repeat (TPR)-like superfamily protein [Tanacetum cinerariifolium]